jgi:Anti-sigma factor NepR
MTNEKQQVPNPNSVDLPESEMPALPPFVQEEIGRRLRAVYGKLAAEPLPDKFVKLLDELSKSDNSDGDDADLESKK